METTARILPLAHEDPDPAVLDEATRILRDGGLVAFPTETVYGLGADASNPEAVRGIFVAKGRPANNPVIVHVADIEAARAAASEWSEAAEVLARRFWPGPLTLVLPRASWVPDAVTAGGPTVALRIPAHPGALALLRASKLPIAAPSANRSTRLSPTTAAHVAEALGDRIPLILDGGPCPGGIESTVLDLQAHPPKILRPGLLSADTLRGVLGFVDAPAPPHGATSSASTAAIARSPGQLPLHYAPRTPTTVIEPPAPPPATLPPRVALVTFDCPVERPHREGAHLALPDNPDLAARHLYAQLHLLDAEAFDEIRVVLPPEGAAWAAIRDRLARAAGLQHSAHDSTR